MVLRVDRPTIELWNVLAGWPSRARLHSGRVETRGGGKASPPISPNPPMGGVNAGQIGMRDLQGRKPGLHWDRCDAAEVFQ